MPASFILSGQWSGAGAECKLEEQLEVDEWHEVRLLQGPRELPTSSPLLLLTELGLDETQQLQAIISESPSKAIAILEHAQYEDWALWEEALRRVTQLGSRAAPWTHLIAEQFGRWTGHWEGGLLVAAKSAVWMDPMACFRQLLIHAHNGDIVSAAKTLEVHDILFALSSKKLIIYSIERADFKQPSVEDLRLLLSVMKLSISDDSFMDIAMVTLKTTYEPVFVPMMDIPEYRNLGKQSFHDALAYSKKQKWLTKFKEAFPLTALPLLLSIRVLGKIVPWAASQTACMWKACKRKGGPVRFGSQVDSSEGLEEAVILARLSFPPGERGDDLRHRLGKEAGSEIGDAEVGKRGDYICDICLGFAVACLWLTWFQSSQSSRCGGNFRKHFLNSVHLGVISVNYSNISSGRRAAGGLPGMEITAVSGKLGSPVKAPLGYRTGIVAAAASVCNAPVIVTDSRGRVGVGQSEELLAKAEKNPLDHRALDEVIKLSPGTGPPDDDVLRGFWRQGSKLDGGVGIDTSDLEDGLFIPRSQLQLARQRATEHLLQQRLNPPALQEAPKVPAPGSSEALAALSSLSEPMLSLEHGHGVKVSEVTPVAPKLTVLCRSREQAEAALSVPEGLVYEVQLDFMEAQGLEEAVAAARAAGRRVAVCLPRVLKPDEDRLWQFYLGLKADALLVRSAGALNQLLRLDEESGPAGASPSLGGSEPEIIGDFSLNAANAITASAFMALPGLQRLTPTHDLSAAQICQLARHLGPERAARLEVIAHQHLPIFHTEHCVFCRFLSNGNDYTDCGHPCEKNALHLRDINGQDHRVVADMGCRNTIFNAKAQSAAMDLAAFAAAGIGFLRLELVDEPASAVETLVKKYHSAARGSLPAEKLWSFVAGLPDANGRHQG
ncbi:unnamed protein product, partial [Polarella glacialis]